MPAQERVLLSELAVARLCGVHVATVGRWRRLGIGPPFERRGRRVVYDRVAVLEWWNCRRRP
jgi:DNA-binding transcriptional MerR regulator